MAASTKKVGSAGRYGTRYSALGRKQVATIERVQRAKHRCQQCGHEAVVRQGTGLWSCRKCDYTFAGGAYTPQTGAGRGAQKALKGIGDKLVRAREDAFVAPVDATPVAETEAEDEA